MGDAAAKAVVGGPERAGRAGDQPLPAVGQASVFAEVRRRQDEREATGIRRYGRSLQTFNRREACRDLWEELNDALVYLTQFEMEMAALELAVVALGRRVRGEDAEFGSVEAALEVAEAVEAKLARRRGGG